MKKKLVSILLMAAMVLSLVGCGKGDSQDKGSDGKDGKIKLTFSWWGNQIRNEGTKKALDAYTAKNPNITFDGQFSEWGDYWTKLKTDASGHNLPDIVQMDYKYLSQYVDNKLLVDLKPYIESGVLDVSGIDQGILDSGSIDGGVYAICIGVNAPALLYNKTLLDENNIAIKDNMSMDDFFKICQEVYEKTGVRTDLSYCDGDPWIDYTLRSQGIALYTEDGKLAAKSADDFLPYYEYYEKGLKEGWLCKPEIYTERAMGSVEQKPLVYGESPESRSWCHFAFSNQLAASQKAADAEGIEIGITTYPADNAKAANYLKPGQFLSISTDSKNPEEAAKVLNYWTKSIECNEILMGERGVPADSETASALLPKLDATQQASTAYVNDVVTANCSKISPVAPEQSPEILKLLDTIIEELCYGKINAKQAAEKLFKDANEILK